MQRQAGIIIQSTAALNDSVFANALVLITEYNANGAIGFVVNKPSSRRLNDLEAYKYCPAISLFEGGPVDTEHLYFIHQRPDVISGGAALGAGVFFGGEFEQVINAINEGLLKNHDLKIFIGYCGWDKHELDEEIQEGS